MTGRRHPLRATAALTGAEIVTCSLLQASPAGVWDRIATFEGINYELGPWLRMTAPARVRERGLEGVVVGQRLCRSWVLLGGVLPIDFDDITLVRLEPGAGFLERSPMLSQRFWEHERTLKEHPEGTVLCDRVCFCPRGPVPTGAVRPLIAAIFGHRHRRLRVRFGGRAIRPHVCSWGLAASPRSCRPHPSR